jgi:hypothetical protein
MVFVPVVPPQRAVSARAQDLGRRLKAEIEKFEAQYPGTSKEDLRAAAAIAIGEESVSVPARRRVAAAVAAGIAALGAGMAVIESRGYEGGGPGAWPILAIAVAAACAGLLAAFVRRRFR